MVATLREGKAKLSKLVERASRGQDVLITVRGKVKARLTRAAPTLPARTRSAWVRRLEKLGKKYAVKPLQSSLDRILAEDREHRF